MSEAMSSPWIRDYFTDVAENHGAQLYNVPVSQKRRRVQLTDFLTYQENNYIWAWASDKEYRVSIRISKDAVDQYKCRHGRSVVDSRFSLVFVSYFRPMFSPRPLGPHTFGNTPMSHLSLEVGFVSSIGTGSHLFGNPRDLESNEKMKEWVLGLRQDGGGGNILKLRKQQDLAQENGEPASPPSPPSFSQYVPVSPYQTPKAAEDAAKPKPERPQDFKRTYDKRWRIVEIDPWKFATKPAAEEPPTHTEASHVVEPPLDSANQLEFHNFVPSARPTSPHRTPSPTLLPRQGTPTDWSPSNRGSPVAPDDVQSPTFGNGIQQRDEPEVLPTTTHLSSDTEGHITVDSVAAITSETRSLQPPTPAQRIKRSSLRRSSSLPRSSPEPPGRCPSRQLLHSSPLLSSSSLPVLSQGSKPRLENFVVDFKIIDLGEGVPIPRLEWHRDIRSVLLRTGRIRTLGEEVENDGSVYIDQE